MICMRICVCAAYSACVVFVCDKNSFDFFLSTPLMFPAQNKFYLFFSFPCTSSNLQPPPPPSPASIYPSVLLLVVYSHALASVNNLILTVDALCLRHRNSLGVIYHPSTGLDQFPCLDDIRSVLISVCLWHTNLCLFISKNSGISSLSGNSIRLH